MDTCDFVVVGSGGGGGTISWLLAKAGFSVVLLEQGPDLRKEFDNSPESYNARMHDEYRFRLKNPRTHRRPRGSYNTRAKSGAEEAAPFGDMGGWTGSSLGGGSVIWGTWALRALPVDFQLASHFQDLVPSQGADDQLKELNQQGYSIVDWPISYSEMAPYYNVAEALLGVSGDRQAMFESIRTSDWYKQFLGMSHFGSDSDYRPEMELPLPAYPTTPVGHFIHKGLDNAKMSPCPLPVAIVNPKVAGYATREGIAQALSQWDPESRPEFWQQAADQIWSDRIRSTCTMCGFCGEYICWGKEGPKFGTQVSTIKEFEDLPNTEVICNAQVYEVLYDEATQRSSGVAYLDVSEDPDNPIQRVQRARHVIISCGAVQSARLLLMSGSPQGLGNKYDQLGANVTFHLFGLGSTVVLKPEFQGLLHGEFGPTGNTASFANYFVQDTGNKWYKAGIFASTARKNPLDNAIGKVSRMKGAQDLQNLLSGVDEHTRTIQLRITGDDLPRPDNRVKLDKKYVDEYGLPVARINRNIGDHENQMTELIHKKFNDVFSIYKNILTKNPRNDKADLTLIGDHQMGTCRMGDDPKTSVLNRYCQMHEALNVFVVDSSFMPTGLGVNPMLTVVANALRVGSWIVEQSKQGNQLV
jgi:choline dehydrogenase-like flavoprotein